MKQISLIPFLALVGLLLAGCGPSSSNTPSKRKDTTPAPTPAQKECPTSQPTNAHKVIINFTRAFPAKLGLKFEGDTDFRLSDCSNASQKGVTVAWKRNTNMQLELLVEHGAAFNNSLPDSQSVELVDLKDCANNGAETIFKTTTPLKISRRTENPVSGCIHVRAMGTAVNQAAAEE